MSDWEPAQVAFPSRPDGRVVCVVRWVRSDLSEADVSVVAVHQMAPDEHRH